MKAIIIFVQILIISGNCFGIENKGTPNTYFGFVEIFKTKDKVWLLSNPFMGFLKDSILYSLEREKISEVIQKFSIGTNYVGISETEKKSCQN